MKSEDLYTLQDGTRADPSEVSRGDDGVYRHKNGLAVLLDSNGKPQTVGDASKANMNIAAAKVGKSELSPADEPKDSAVVGDGDKAKKIEPLLTTNIQPEPQPAPPAEPRPVR